MTAATARKQKTDKRATCMTLVGSEENEFGAILWALDVQIGSCSTAMYYAPIDAGIYSAQLPLAAMLKGIAAG